MNSRKYPQSVNFSQALKIVQSASINHQLDSEFVPLSEANNRVINETIMAGLNVPSFDCSRMDGFAINYEYLNSLNDKKLPLNKAIHAGQEPNKVDVSQMATPVMTGAALPIGTNAVVMSEHAQVDGMYVRFEGQIQKQQNIRKAGSDVKKGQLLFKPNRAITACDLGVLSSVGLSDVSVYKKPRVVMMMTGDELVKPGQNCQNGQIYDSNSLPLKSYLEQLGCEVKLLSTVTDDLDEVKGRLDTAIAHDFDVCITVGGVSMGDKDWLPRVLSEQGETLFHKVNIKPGFPLLFGFLGSGLFFGLPGNPVSAFTTMLQYVYPAILNMYRLDKRVVTTWRAVLLEDIQKTHLRREFMRGRFNMSTSGTLEVVVCGSQQSSRVKSLSEANCLIILNESQQNLKSGETVMIQPFSQLNHLSES